jgi:hypothetical protein
MDNFIAYGIGVNMFDGTPWTSDGLVSVMADPDPNAPAGSRCINMRSFSSGPNSAGRFNLPTPGNVIGAAFRIWCGGFPSGGAGTLGFSFRNAANGGLYEFYIGANGKLFVNSDQGLVADTVAPLLVTNTWIHLEVRINTVTGAIAVWKEGVPVAALTVVDPSPINQPIAIVAFSSSTPGSGTGDNGGRIKDVVFYDGVMQIGPVSIFSLTPNADVSSGWTRSAGATDYGLIDEAGPPVDTDYISAPHPPPAPSIMQLSNLPADIVAVRGLMSIVRAKKSDGGDGNLQVGLISGASTDEGANRAIQTTFGYHADVSELDPATGLAWTPTAVNNANLKINRVA